MAQNVCMVFAGDAGRGNRFQEVVKGRGWRIHTAAGPEQALALCRRHDPDLVIIDDFPGSEAARLDGLPSGKPPPLESCV